MVFLMVVHLLEHATTTANGNEPHRLGSYLSARNEYGLDGDG